MLAQTLLFSLIGSLGAIAGSALLLLSGPRRRESLLPALISYATGTLLGAAFLGMIPSSLQQAPAHAVSATVLAGIVLFFALEKAVLWRHCHDAGCPAHGATGPLILIGDAFHNFVDGVVIAAAFHVSPDVGVATAVAVIAHELPQEVGDFALLLGHGYGARKALLLNALSASATLPGALLGHFALAEARAAVPWVLALSAASFIYIAVSDLMPRRTARFRSRRHCATAYCCCWGSPPSRCCGWRIDGADCSASGDPGGLPVSCAECGSIVVQGRQPMQRYRRPSAPGRARRGGRPCRFIVFHLQ